MNKPTANWIYLILLILAGEAVFVLPFVLQRIFRSTVLSVFELNNTELGLCFTYYGLVAMISYLLGGPIADRFEPRKLLAFSLWSTALGGLVYASFPGIGILQLLYAYWGFTTIFLFWSPMIKAARVWGGAYAQGKAFGVLDGGRGFVGVLFGVLAVGMFSVSLAGEETAHNLEEQRQAFRWAIYGVSLFITIIGVLIWFFLKAEEGSDKPGIDRLRLHTIAQVIRLQSVWLLMLIVLFAYTAYKATDVISLYAREVLKYGEVQSALIGNFLLFIRPVTGVLIGLFADRFHLTLMLVRSFLVLCLGSVWFALGWGHSFTLLFLLSVLIIAVGTYAARALYFAVLKEGKIPLQLTGTAVGLISVVGFTPDIFAGVGIGYLLDANPDRPGHQDVFALLAVFSMLGAWSAWRYHKISSRSI